MKQEEIRNQFDYNQVEKIHGVLYDIYTGKSASAKSLLRFSTFHPKYKINARNSIVGKLLNSKKDGITISKNTANLGLLLLNCFTSYQNKGYWSYTETVSITSKRFKALQEQYNLDTLWDNEHYDLLILCFGEPLAKTIKKAYNTVGKLMYQQGYERRSFRKPNDTDFNQVLKVNFIISLLNSETVHPFNISEIIKYNCAEYYSRAHLLVASEIDNNTEIYGLCTDILQGNAEIGNVSTLLIKSLLLSNKPEAWEQVGKLLLSAQRQEGLRQTILEALDETSIGAFQYILKLVNEHNLSRFSSVVRSMDVWAGFGWDTEKQSTIKRFFQLAERYVLQPELLEKTIKNKDNAEVYMAFWGQGVHDIDKCYPYLKELYKNGTLEKKQLVLYFVNQANIFEWNKEFAYLALAEEKTVFNYWAVNLFNKSLHISDRNSLYTKIEELFKNFPKKSIEFKSNVFSWTYFKFEKEQVSKLLVHLTDTKNTEELDRLLIHYKSFPIETREKIAGIILHNFDSWSQEENTDKPTQKQRDFAFDVLTDRSSLVRNRAISALKNAEIKDDELLVFEDLLTRKSSEFRQFSLETIQKKGDKNVLASAERLIEKSNIEQRLAGLDLLNALHKKKVHTTEITSLANEFSQRARIGKKEQILLDNLLQKQAVTYNAENGYGLYNPEDISEKTDIKTPTKGVFVDAFFNSKNPYGFSMSIKEIEEKLIDLKNSYVNHKDYEYEATFYDGSKQKLLLSNSFHQTHKANKENGNTPEEIFKSYPLHEKWNQWFQNSRLTSYDLFLIHFVNDRHYHFDAEQHKKAQKTFSKTIKKLDNLLPKVKIPRSDESLPFYYYNPILQIIKVLQEYHTYEFKKEFFENAVAYTISVIDRNEMSKVIVEKNNWGYSNDYSILNFEEFSSLYYTSRNYVDEFSDDEFANYWRNIIYFYNNSAQKDKTETRPTTKWYARAYEQKLCTKSELTERIMHPDAIELLSSSYKNVKNWRKEELKAILDNYPFMKELAEKCTKRILEIELRRGDSTTSVTRLASEIQRVEGIDYLIQILNGLGKDTLSRGYFYGEKSSKKEVLSALLKCCHPTEKETQADFNTKIKDAKFTEKRLVEVALYAQQWLPFIENYLQWKGLSSAVWWLHAHTNSYHSAETETEFARYSKIDIKDFKDGAVDFDWFQEAYKQIGKVRWKILYNSAKYISDGTGHARAKLYADVMTGEIKIREVTKRVKEKRNQDYLRVYGLVPLSKKIPEKDVLSRYNYLLQFKKESRQFGSQRQASEKLAVKIAMDNLARTAGYPDPIRLTWAMETEEAKTILQKAEMLTFNDVSINLKVDTLGKAHIEVQRDGKKLKSIPAKLRKEKTVVELKELHKRLKNQYSRSRKSLEEAMVRGDVFQAKEIQTLTEHPVIAPMLQSLVLISENGLGFYKDGKLTSTDGKTHELGEKIRIAHCTDLYTSKEWATYQRYCFDNEIIQPFKQIFRELYVPTPDELQEKTISRRYAGHQVQPKKTVALLKTRAWTVDYEEGLQKVFHNEGMIAKMYAMADWFSPADVESPTLETVEFLDRKTHKRIPFEKVNPLLFSEVMRDIDLVVSVAHVGGVDPEASQSTVEMRSVIIAETARLFKLKNVELKGHHALIKGEKGDYNVHLGSGVTHFNGKYISVLPVHSQHRGRLFLPFVDEDPRSAEIMAKILLFAKDKEIKDPTILEQLK